MRDLSDDELLAQLGVSVKQEQKRKYTPREERIIAGFEDILRFYQQHSRAPRHGGEHDIFERLYAVRLDQLKEQSDYRELLAEMDEHGLLTVSESDETVTAGDMDDDALLSQLGVEVGAQDAVSRLKHVPSYVERKAAEEIASQIRCEDFEKFNPIFAAVEADLAANRRITRPFGKDAAIHQGDLFILRGQIAYVAEVGETLKAPNGEYDARLRVIYSNGTESNLLRRSLQRALYDKDDVGRRITNAEAGPLFADHADEGDTQSGTIYVIQSLSEHPDVVKNRTVLHKIGVTGGSVTARIANAKKEATYLLADVKVVAEYKLYGISRVRLEKLLHKFFSPAAYHIRIDDRFGNPVNPREWFLVPLQAIDEAVERIRDGSITDYRYDTKTASVLRR